MSSEVQQYSENGRLDFCATYLNDWWESGIDQGRMGYAVHATGRKILSFQALPEHYVLKLLIQKCFTLAI